MFCGLFVAPIIWAGSLMSDYALVSHACYPGDVPLAVPSAGFGFVWPLVFAFHLVSVAVIAGGFVLSLRNWRRTGPPQGHAHELMHRGEGRSRYFGIIAMGWATILFVIVATQTVPSYGWGYARADRAGGGAPARGRVAALGPGNPGSWRGLCSPRGDPENRDGYSGAGRSPPLPPVSARSSLPWNRRSTASATSSSASTWCSICC